MTTDIHAEALYRQAQSHSLAWCQRALALLSTLLASLFVALVLLAAPFPAHAKAYKCVGVDGGVTYSQTQCPVEAQTAGILASSSSKRAVDCRIAYNFTTAVVASHSRGASSEVVFDQYGGLNALSGSAISLINYVYTYGRGGQVSPSHLTALTQTNCKAGAFGDVSCERFPSSFIGGLGGCEAAMLPGGMPGGGMPRAGMPEVGMAGGWQAPGSAGAQAAGFGAAAPTAPAQFSRAGQAESVCRSTLQANIDVVKSAMRAKASPQVQTQLQARYHALRRAMRECG